ncbi:hypothetical protein [Paenibacillus sp. PAMC21692]|uniref:hypothetical protein n=1 Tax=Paenibacillus sp. PAMC21692 TaxID=2762320 RepID=UPI00164E8256|nr:hypothetical protein [Paenibacillus sp. PAMC21692]QNK58970.1 hypothetical protein H7F31_08945 [Paenibacillus sp. PAMC21692]
MIMTRIWLAGATAAAVAAMLLLGGCSAAMDTDDRDQIEAHSAEHEHQTKMLRDPSVIPSENGLKQQTTNRQGGTTNGMGTSVYGMIGSSGLHAAGFSAHLESRLSGAGIPDVKVFVFDDTVVLATAKRTPSGARYDSVQMKLLSPIEGMSGQGTAPGEGLGGITGTDKSAHDNLSMAAERITGFMGGGEVRVLTVENEMAVQMIDKIRTEATAEKLSPTAIADDIRALLELAVQGTK